jgi:hypothetical protein
MKINETVFLSHLDIISGSCRIRNAFVKLWKRGGIEWAMIHAKGLDENKLNQLRVLIKEFEIQ